MDLLAKIKAKAAIRDSAAPKDPIPAKKLDLSSLELRQQISKDLGTGYVEYVEIDRILKLPIISPMTQEEVDAWAREHVLASAWDSGFRLFREQAEAGLAYELYGGAFCTIGVGFGKTLASLMIAGMAYAKGLRKIAYIIPPNVLPQLTNTDIAWARSRIPMGYSIHVLGGLTPEKRKMISQSGRPGLYVLTYSLLSTEDGEQIIKDIEPELIIADEAHNLAKARAARSKRLWKYVAQKKPEMVALSGTMSQKSVRDYWHLINSSLKDNCPLPISSALASEWGTLIDAGAAWDSMSQASASGPLLPVVGWAKKNFPAESSKLIDSTAGFRHAYRLRLNSAPGVVDSGDSSIKTSLVICNEPVPEHEKCQGWDELKAIAERVEQEWTTPNGDEIEHSIHTFKWLYEIYGGGFYNELTWPTVPTVVSRRGIPEKAAEELIERSMEHHALGQEYAKELRTWLQETHHQGIDTPFLVGNDMRINGSKNVGEHLYASWKLWKDSEFEGLLVRDSRAVRLCDFKIRKALKWAQELPEGKGGICWVFHQEVGTWASEVFRAAGINVLHCPAGKIHDAAILDKANAGKVVIASIVAHGTGKNLQHFQHQFYLQWPRPAKDAEQSLGRTHRSGQEADELVVHTCHTTDFDYANFAACLNDALYIQQTLGSRQKLVYATYFPLPKIFPSEVLRERGFDPKVLPPEAIRVLRDKFGSK